MFALHNAHVSIDVADTDVDADPGGHKVQFGCAPGEYVPAGQFCKFVELSMGYLPGGASLQIPLPVEDVYVPVGHAIQVSEAFAARTFEYVPFGHFSHKNDLPREYVPMGQGVYPVGPP